MAFGTALRDYLNENPEVFDRNAILGATSGALKDEAKRVLKNLKN